MGRILASAFAVLLALPALVVAALWHAPAPTGSAPVSPTGSTGRGEDAPDAPVAPGPPRRSSLPARLLALVLTLFAAAVTLAAFVLALGGERAAGIDRSLLSPLALLAVGLWGVLTVWKVPQWQAAAWRGDREVDPKEAFEVENGARATLGQILSGLAILAGLFFAWQQLGQTSENLQVSQEGQITDRFTKAIDQLGGDALTVRLGGIYALERIARDSPRDYPATMEVLAAFARRPAGAATPAPGGSAADPVPQDVEAVLRVIGRRTPEQVAQEAGLGCLHLEGVRLDGANLAGYNLTHLCLDGASLSGANLSGAALAGSGLVGANLANANLDRADLDGAMLSGADLAGANLSGADLGRANLLSANLSGAILQEANLSDAVLVSAALPGALLLQTDLRRADLLDADLTGATISGANLSGAVRVTGAQLDAAMLDRTTTLPDGLTATPDF